MSKSLLGLIFALFLTQLLKAEQPIFNITSLNANPGEIIDINFHVNDFTDILSVQHSINWNSSVLELKSIKNLNSSVNQLTQSSFNVVEPGKITFVWWEPSITPVTLPDGSLLYTLEFEVIGAPCQSSPVAITEDPIEIEVSDVNNDDIGLVANNGLVTIPGVGCSEGINITGNSVVGACGGEACVRFTVSDFTDVASMDFALNFNPSVLQFDRFQSFAPLNAFGTGNVNLSAPGVLRVVWINLNAENESLPNGATLFEICFDVIGSGGQSSQISLGATPPVEIADANSNIYTVNFQPANITAECQVEGFALIAGTECTEPNGIVCIPISVHDFDNILSAQFSINWDPTLFVFDHLENLNLAELTPDAFATPPDIAEGRLSVSWFNLNTATVPDFDSIFTLCLRAIGPAGSVSPITFTHIPSEIEIATEDSILAYSLLHGQASIKVDCDACNISYTLNPTSPNCPREATGSLNLNLDIGNCVGPATFLWSFEGRTTEDLINVEAGTYTVTITVGTQIVVASGTIMDPLGMGTMVTITNPVPPGSSTGIINLTVTGGTPPYTFRWNTNPVVTTEDLINVPAGSYTVTITDAQGCTFIPDAFIVGADISGIINNPTCNGLCNGSITANPSFGVAPYTYVWNTTPVQTTATISNLCAGTYCVTITDNAGSTSDTCFTLTQPQPIVLSATIVGDVNMDCQGAIDLHVTGGINPFTYLWSNGATSQDIINLCPGTYCVTVTDGNGCTATACYTVTSGNLILTLTASQPTCGDTCDGSITSMVTGATGAVTYLWSHNLTTQHLNNLCSGVYTLTVTDAAGNTASATRTIISPQAITFTVIKTNPMDYTTNDGSISIIPSGGVAPYTYQWIGPIPLPGSFASMNNLPAGTYRITVTDANGCDFSSLVELPPGGLDCFSANRIITPNDDGKNDYFIIQCIIGIDNHLFIFNRYGGLVYETDNYTNNWSGFDQDNQPIADGGYLWVLEFNDVSGPRILKGTVNVLRTAD